MFNQGQNVDTRMAVIEEKFTVYEKMMDKLESAIQTISEINQNISRMLSVHEEKIDGNIKNDGILFDKLKRIEEKNTEEHQRVVDRIEKFEDEIKKVINKEQDDRKIDIEKIDDKINGITKFRWIFVGAVAVIMFIFSNSPIIVDILTPNQEPARIEKAN